MKKLIYFSGALLGLGAFLMAPRFKYKKEVKRFLNYSYAHRGLHDKESPENTLGAVKKAVEEGYAIEMDVRVLEEGLLIHHDGDLLRSAGLDKKLQELSFSQIRELRIFSSQEKIPSLEEALEIIDGRVPLLLEIKSERDHSLNASRVQEVMDGYRGDYLIESFHPQVLYWYRKNRPQVLRGQLSGPELDQGPFKDFFMKYLLFNFISRPDFIAYDKRGGFSPWLLNRLGLPTFSYTLLSPGDKKSYLKGEIFEGYRPR